MRVLHVIRDLSRSTGGPVTALRGLADAQVDLGHEVSVVAGDIDDEKVLPSKADVHLVAAGRNAWRWSSAFRPKLAELVRQTDIVHAHMVWDYPVWEAATLARKFGKPFVLRPCGNLEAWSLQQSHLKKSLYLRLFGRIVTSAAAAHLTSESEHVLSADALGDLPAFVIPLGVLTEGLESKDHGNSFLVKFPTLRDEKLVLFLGRLHAKKRPELLIEAFALSQSQRNFRLVLAGPGHPEYLSSLRERARCLGLADRVTFTGQLLGSEVRDAYRAAAMFVLPSLQENFGIAVAEALAASCPVIISDRVGIAGEIKSASAGIICALDTVSIAEAIDRLAASDDLRSELGSNGRRLVLRKYTWPRAAEMTIEMYEQAVARRSPTAASPVQS